MKTRAAVAFAGAGDFGAGQHRDDLVRCLATAAAPAHAISHDAEHTTGNARVTEQGNLVLLIVAVSLVNTGGGSDSITFGHIQWPSHEDSIYLRNRRIIRRSSAHGEKYLELESSLARAATH